MPKYYVKLMTWFEVNDEETDPTNGNDRNKIASMTRDGMLDMGVDKIGELDFYAEVSTNLPPSYKGMKVDGSWKVGWKPKYGEDMTRHQEGMDKHDKDSFVNGDDNVRGES